MSDRTQPPARMRSSFESRGRAVGAMAAGHPVGKVARAQGVSRATAYRWWVRFRAEGWAGLHDRRSTPHRQPRRLSPELEARILAARLDSGDGPQVLAAQLRLAASSVRKGARAPLGARAARRAAPPRHQETGAVLAAREAGVSRRKAAQPPRRLALPPRGPSTTTAASATPKCCPPSATATP